MNLNRYEFDFFPKDFRYEFYSVGPKGRIKKLLQFQPASANVGDMFNLAFGDLDEKTESMDDSARSNNGDTVKVLATIAHILLHFTDIYPDAKIIAAGTSSRNRLYRMHITRQFLPIYILCKISGVTEDNVIEPLVKNKAYAAFIVQRRLLKKIS